MGGSLILLKNLLFLLRKVGKPNLLAGLQTLFLQQYRYLDHLLQDHTHNHKCHKHIFS